jgi:MerR family transcriptional regulator, light-induced transcriptional regulator
LAPSVTLSIGALAERTGVSVDTLRAWEGRYGAIAPVRTQGGHRRYSENDVDRILWLVVRLEAGHRIGAAVADLRAVPGRDVEAQLRADVEAGKRLTERIVTASLEGDEARLEQAVQEAFVGLSFVAALELAIFPALAELGMLWANRAAGPAIAAEHLLTEATIRKLALTFSTTQQTEGPVCIIFCPPREHHTLGALALAVLLSLDGWRVVFLGANVPIPDVARLSAQRRAVAAIGVCTLPKVAHATRRDLAKRNEAGWVLTGPGTRAKHELPEGVELWGPGLLDARHAAGQRHATTASLG